MQNTRLTYNIGSPYIMQIGNKKHPTIVKQLTSTREDSDLTYAILFIVKFTAETVTRWLYQFATKKMCQFSMCAISRGLRTDMSGVNYFDYIRKLT